MNEQVDRTERILGGLWGAVVGDALGVPVEFYTRDDRKRDPVTGMRGYGTHNQPPGTWSDDSSLLLCTVDSLINHDFDLSDMGQRFVRWYREGYWTPCGQVFDIGGTTRRAIKRLEKGVAPEKAGDSDENSNGNGSLMRILPVALRFADVPAAQLLDYAHRASGLTHRHPRSRVACGFYCLMAAALLKGSSPLEAYTASVETGLKVYAGKPYLREMAPFRKFVSGRIHELPESDIGSGGYVVDTLEACVWCMLNSSSFEEAVLKAINLGGDTDTTGCVTGGLAGVHHGVSAILKAWKGALVRKENLKKVFGSFCTSKRRAISCGKISRPTGPNLPSSNEVSRMRRRLIAWFRKYGRTYPWRTTSDPFKVLVAETMLRRTKADQVKQVYEEFVAQYPDLEAVSVGSAEGFAEMLEPLGLHWRIPPFCSMVREIKIRYGSKVPDSREELKSLPGVGDYVAGAVLSIALNKREWIVDSNVLRVFKRYFGLPTSREGRRDKHIIAVAKQYVAAKKPRDANLAILDFAALVCTPKNPRHDGCPLRAECRFSTQVHG